MVPIKLLSDYVLIKLDPDQDTIVRGDLVLQKPDAAHDHVFRSGRVVSTGPGKWNKKKTARLKMLLEPGMRILFVKFVATHTRTAESIQYVVGKDHAVIKQNDALLMLDEEFDVTTISQ